MDKVQHSPGSKYLFYVLLWAAALLIFAYGWVPGGLDTDSCNYAAVAKEIVHTNKWLGIYDPVYQGIFYYHFPLCIWITAGLFKLCGISTFTAKLFSMFCGVALVAALFYFGKLLQNKWVGFLAGLSLLLTNHIVRLARQCRMDLPVTLFITLALFSFVLAEKRSRGYYLLFGLFTSLAIMAKDVFGLAPLAIVFTYLVIRLDYRRLFDPFFISGLLLAVAPVLFWIWLDQGALITGWYRWNFLHLFKSASFIVPWYYYILAILTKYFYFLPFALYGGYLAIKQARRNKNYELYLLIIWVVIFPLAFSFGKQKLHYFILPLYPAAALLTAMALDKMLRDKIKIKISVGLKYLLVAISIVMLSLPLRIQSKRFIETVKLAPAVDEILRQLTDYEFICYNQDKAAILFYSQELSRAKSITNKQSLEESLGRLDKLQVCYLSMQDFSGLSNVTRNNCRVIFQYKDNMIIVNRRDVPLVVKLS